MSQEKEQWDEAMNGPTTPEIRKSQHAREQEALPPCANWKVWIGKEVEGTANVGASTLFIRELPLDNLLSLPEDRFDSLQRLIAPSHVNFSRVWFCKEFHDWVVAQMIFDRYCFLDKCVERDIVNSVLPPTIRKQVRVYWKQPLNLLEGDFICIGRPFSDEAFEIGKGAKVTPEMYLNDVRLY